ncbi:hypothetical protein [Streptosporangium sp. NPDC051022]|uniref:hypothetical protein n=1 Tax=Streptosporangium sp. NPDC051022 TaxID=3155752 RepID=UPI00341D632C
MSTRTHAAFQLGDIQRGVLSPRPSPYATAYILFRIDDRAHGRELMRRVRAVVTSAADTTSPLGETWVSVTLTFHLPRPHCFMPSLSPLSRLGDLTD